jgi:hypothetical protein
LGLNNENYTLRAKSEICYLQNLLATLLYCWIRLNNSYREQHRVDYDQLRSAVVERTGGSSVTNGCSYRYCPLTCIGVFTKHQ